MVNSFMMEIASEDWTLIAEDEYKTTRKFEAYVKEAMVYCYDQEGNSLAIATKKEDFAITFTSVINVDMKVMILIPIDTTILDDKQEDVETTSTYLNEDKGYLEISHLNNEGLPVVQDMSETHNVSPINCSIQLTEIPDKFYDVVLKAKNNIQLNRVYDLADLENTKVAYYIGKNNMIYCSYDLVGQYITIEYKGMGKILTNCNMIYYRDKINNVPVILEELIDKGGEALYLLGTVGDASRIINLIKENTIKAKEQDKELVQTITNAHDTNLILKDTINLATGTNKTLTTSIATADARHKTLTTDVANADTRHNTLVKDTATAKTQNDTLVQTTKTASSTNTTVNNTIGTANTTKKALEGVITTAKQTHTNLNNLIISAKIPTITVSGTAPTNNKKNDIWIQV